MKNIFWLICNWLIFRAAQQLVEELRRAIPNVNLSYYLSGEVLRDMEKATGMKLTSTAASGIGSGGGVDAEEIGEEVVGEWSQPTMQPKMHPKTNIQQT